ncbi:uncharacterized protein LOC111519300 [Drosophila willistoni]|uniref:uncharacterized protein LOC111519300 n=1 Tax=Drosophila willistoni TaxID=7260 RepID=UPI000C26D3C0|nr:uncharacterized protein LOC111519300 [Drosophila willistoni]
MSVGNIKTEPMDGHGIPPSLNMDNLDVNLVKSEPEQDFEEDTDVVDVPMDYYFYNEQEVPSEEAENVTTTTTTMASKTGKKGKRTSKTKMPGILKFFGNIERVGNSSGRRGVISASCNACQSRIRGSMSVTSNFIKHLRTKHFDLHAAFIKSKKLGHSDSGTTSSSITTISTVNSFSGDGHMETAALTSSDLNSFDNRILDYIIDTAAPISTVGRSSFRKLFKGTNLRVMNCSKLIERLDDRFVQMSQYIKHIVCQQKYLCTTADIWSIGESNFLAYTAHWLDEKYDRHSVALAFRKLPNNDDDHNELPILDVIKNLNSEYDINSSLIVCTMTNNSLGNYLNIFRQFGIDYQHSNEIKTIKVQSKTLCKQIECASHSLNLLISIDFIDIISKDRNLRETHMQIFQKLSHIWRKCQELWASEHLGESLITPIVTKCNSIYDAICCIITHKEQLPEICGQLDLPDITFTTNDLEYLNEYRTLMSPIAATIEFLENESNLYYGCLIPALTSLYVKLKRISKESPDIKVLKNTAIEFQDVLKKRFAIYFNLTEDAHQAIIAAVLCPSLKMRWFNALANICRNGCKADDIHRIVIAEAVRYAKLTDNDNTKLMNSEQFSATPRQQDCDDFFEFEDVDETSDDTKSSNLADLVNVQFQSYLRDTGTTFDILDKYPLLQDLSMKFNTPLPSPAPLERLFSIDTIGSQWRRCDQSSDYSVERLLLIKANGGLVNKL